MMDNEDSLYDVVIIGAGAAGLVAAWELTRAGKKTVVVEARDRIGGRIDTIQDPDFDLPVERGAEFIHGKLELTQLLMDKTGTEEYEVSGSIWQNKNGALSEQKDFIEDFSALEKKFRQLKNDISVAEFLNKYVDPVSEKELYDTLKTYVEGYYAADTNRASTFSLQHELLGSDDEQYRVEGGYVKLVRFLYDECKSGNTVFYFNLAATEVAWSKNRVTVRAGEQTFRGIKLIVTVPIGVLQSEAIRFTPDLPDKLKAVKNLGFGPVIKTLLQFTEPFWKQKTFTGGNNLSDLSFIFSEEKLPTWWTYHPKKGSMLAGWAGGPHAEDIKNLDDQTILEASLESLSKIFTIESNEVKKRLKGWHVANWISDPYCLGGYSYEVVNGSAFQKILNDPEEETIYFSGEGLVSGPEIGTVNAAFIHGRETAHKVITSFKK